MEIRNNKLCWVEPPPDQKRRHQISIFRRSYRLFATFKTLGMLFRLTRNIWVDHFRQLKKIWVKGQPESQKELNRIIEGKEFWS